MEYELEISMASREQYRVTWLVQTNKNPREFSSDLAAISLPTTHF